MTATAPNDPAAAPSDRLGALDGLRALAALAVLVTHVGDASGAVRSEIDVVGIFTFPLGLAVQQLNMGVAVFFVVSAFLVYRPFVAAHVGAARPPDALRFFSKRFWRIYPAYWVALSLIVAFSAAKSLPSADVGIRNYLLFQGYVPSLDANANYGLRHAWTLVVEISFYLFVPLWAWALRLLTRALGGARVRATTRLRVEIVGALALVVIGPLFVWYGRHHALAVPLRVLPHYLGQFGFGMLLAAIDVGARRRTVVHPLYAFVARRPWIPWLGGALTFFVFVQGIGIDPLAPFSITARQQVAERFAGGLIAVLFVIPAVIRPSVLDTSATASDGGAIRRLLAWRPLAFIGLVSYGFYLWHYAFVDWLSQHWFTGGESLTFVKIFVLSAIGATLLGAASWWLLERPSIAISRRGFRPPFFVGLTLITVAAFAWRLFYVVISRGRVPLNGDAYYYHTQANDIADGLWFVDPGKYHIFGRITPSAGHPPNYLLYLAGVSKFIGRSELTHRIASTLLGAGAVFLLGLLARRIFDDERAGWLAAAFAGAYAHLWINDEMLMSEGMYQLWTAVALLATYRFWRDPRFATAVGMGAGVAMAALSRAEAMALFPLLVVPLALLLRSHPVRERVRFAAVACVVGGLVLAPWFAFNLTRFEHPVLMSNGIGSVLMVANCDITYGNGGAGDTYLGYWSVGCAEGFGPLQAGDESEKEIEWRARGLDYIGDHPGQQPRMAALRVARMWDLWFVRQNIHPFNAALEGRGDWQSYLATVQYFAMLPFAIVGLFLLRRRKVPILPFLAVAAAITITAATTFGITRYRAPVDALITVLAAGAVISLIDRLRGHPPAPAEIGASTTTDRSPATS